MAEIGNVTVRVDAVITDEQYRVAMGAVMAANECIDLLVAENAKLRELASGLHRCMGDGDCVGCPMQDDDGWCVRDIRLRELGIEVVVS